ncbi:MAG TPA: ABC transporter permease subunit [Micromonosporaceae bacterium]
MNLFRTELRRLAKRRFVRYMVLVGLLVLVAIAGGTYLTNQKIGPAQIAAAERAADRDYQQQVMFVEQHRRECERIQANGTAEEKANIPADCSVIQPPPREAIDPQWHMAATFEFRKEFEPMITAFAAILALVAFAAGASFVGAEWNTGGMMNLLLWRPRRLHVLGTKLAALLAGLVGLFLLSAAAYTAAFWAVGRYRGSTAGMTSGVWQSFALTGLRGLVLVLAAGAIGFGLASLGRHTALALGGALGVAVVGQFGLGILLNIAQVKFFQAWLLPTYLLAWMQKKITLQDYEACQVSYTGECRPDTMDIVWQDTAVLLASGLVLVVGAALWVMRRRDVT